ncbi:MAG: hypothetical protein ACOCV2_13605 [Persicimonas sp.]
MPMFSGDKNEPFGSYNVSKIPIVLSWRRPDYPEVLDAEVRTAEFDEKWADFEVERNQLLAKGWDQLEDDEELVAGEAGDGEVTFDDLLDRLEDGDEVRAELNSLKADITGDDVRAVLGWLDDILVRVEAAEDYDDTVYENEDGEEITEWQELPQTVRDEILGSVPPWEMVLLFRKIKKSVGALSEDQKNG